MRLTAQTPGRLKSPLRGVAYSCTPQGERFNLTFSGEMPRDHGTDLTGVPLHFYMNHRMLFWQLGNDERPSLQFRGSFGDSQLILDDLGSLAKAFRPDGSLYPRGDGTHRQSQNVRVTLKESTLWTTGPTCSALRASTQ
jgi:hypothetical protein